MEIIREGMSFHSGPTSCQQLEVGIWRVPGGWFSRSLGRSIHTVVSGAVVFLVPSLWHAGPGVGPDLSPVSRSP